MSIGLVADIGGTHARFGLISAENQQTAGFRIHSEDKFLCAEHSKLEDVLAAYLESIGKPSLTYGSIAVAAPVWHDEVRMTNLDWSFSISDMQRQFGFRQLEVINDASAGVLATTQLSESEIEQVKPGTAHTCASRVNVIPGTGFGIGAAYQFGTRWMPVQGEGGHIGLAAVEPEEHEVLKQISSVHGRATPENTLSGPGMLNLYQALCAVRDVRPLEVSPREMTELGMDAGDELCTQALNMYCHLLGSLAGDFALVFGAHGGVYLSGKILQKLGTGLLKSGFNGRFSGKGSMSHEVRDIPVHLVTRDHPGLLGAAVWLTSSLDKNDEFWKVVA
jgi:glucokinase